ncbi:MAG TPA: ATP synthase F1 subunit gamma [Cyclobacteriaceae bacterium]|nr:ATP synthase F1 subunit gamma [Cyclobacteriaceae bacterium]
MAGLKEVRNRIKSIISTQQITKAMKMVAASKLRRAQDKILQMRPFAEKLYDILNESVQSLEGSYESEYALAREEKKILIIPITSDRGLCGGFNSNIFRNVRDLIEENYSGSVKNNSLFIMPLGKKAYDFYRRRKFNVIDAHWDIFNRLNFPKVQAAANYVLEGFKKGEFDKVLIVYNEFKNVATQILRVEQFLPIADRESKNGNKKNRDFIFEPDKEAIVKELIPKSLTIQFFKNILESNASEHGARMTAMDQATENASDLLNELRIAYNRTRQATITREINEIVGGANALE